LVQECFSLFVVWITAQNAPQVCESVRSLVAGQIDKCPLIRNDGRVHAEIRGPLEIAERLGITFLSVVQNAPAE
jgi:hypothetical protein